MLDRTVWFALLGLVGCASTRVAIEKPIADQCGAAGLKSCRDLTHGVVMFVEGDKGDRQKTQKARQKLQLGAEANEPADVRAFAAMLSKVPELPGAGAIRGRIQQVIEILWAEAKHAEDRAPPAWGAGWGANPAAAQWSNDRQTDADGPAKAPPPIAPVAALAQRPASALDFDGKTVVPAADDANRACALTGIMSPSGESTKGFCVRVSRGPLVVTDLHSSNACPAELFALAVTPGDLSVPRWAFYAQPGTAINVSSGTLVVREDEHLVIGVMSPMEQRIKRDVRCGVTWSGWRPPGGDRSE